MTDTRIARQTPYELVFGAELFETSLFPDIREEVGARELEPVPPDRFTFLTTVGKLLRVIAGAEPPGGGAPATERRPGSREAAGATGESAGAAALEEYGALLFQGYQFWRHGRQLFVVEEDVVRELLQDDDGVGDDVVQPPHPAGYLQLPRNLVWARAGEEQPPEPVDGVFWTRQELDGDARLDVLLVLGMRPARPGFSVVSVADELEGGRPGDWARNARPDGTDFENVLPGGELDDLFAVTTPAEALKLAALLFRHVERNPGSLGGVEANREGAGPASSQDLPPSELRFRRVGP